MQEGPIVGDSDKVPITSPSQSLTSLGDVRTEPLASTAGLVTDTGLVKAESRPEESEPGLCSFLLAFHGLGYNEKNTKYTINGKALQWVAYKQ